MQPFTPQAYISNGCQAQNSFQSLGEFYSPTAQKTGAQASHDQFRCTYSLHGDSASPGLLSCRINVHYSPFCNSELHSPQIQHPHCPGCFSLLNPMLPLQSFPLQNGVFMNPISLCNCVSYVNVQAPTSFSLFSIQGNQCCIPSPVKKCQQSGHTAYQRHHNPCFSYEYANNKWSTNSSERLDSSKSSIVNMHSEGRFEPLNSNALARDSLQPAERQVKDGNQDIMSDFNDRALQYYNAKIYHFRHGYNLLAKLFLNLEIDVEDLDLSEFEKLVFLYICRRKFTSLSIPVLKDQPLEHEFFEILVAKCKAEPSNKRVEEYTKFILKHTMKHLKNRFKSLKLPSNSDLSPPDFYYHYFKEVSEATKMPLEAFHDPLNNRRYKTEIMPKTLNSDYLQLIFRSKPFAKDFCNYISSNQLITDYMKSIPRKFEKILLRWEHISEERIDRKQFRDRLHDYFFKNKQCKLPWTVNEIAAGINYFLSIMQTLQTYRS